MAEITKQVTCKYCGSEAIVKYGSYKGIPRYYCKICRRKFKADNNPFNMRVPIEYISSALNMYYTGSSIDDIRDHFKQESGYYPSKHVIYNWIEKYTELARNQFQDAKPKVGGEWQVDETVLRLDKKKKIWYFDCIDTHTKYLLASRASYSRTTKDAQLLIDRAIKTAGKNPRTIVTDRLPSYLDVRYGKDTEHRQGSPFRFKETGESTAQIERFHGTIKDRTKVMRAFRNFETMLQFMDGYLIYYNFFRPHEAFKSGKTPAEFAGIDYKIKNWRDLVKIPVSKRATSTKTISRITTKSPKITQPTPRISEKVGKLK
jgi:putative transposase